MLLIKFSENWADEFDCEGFYLCEKEIWNEQLIRLKKLYPTDSNYIEYYFGTNESLEFTSVDDLLLCYKIMEISKTEVEVLISMFGESIVKYGYGICPTLERFIECVEY